MDKKGAIATSSKAEWWHAVVRKRNLIPWALLGILATTLFAGCGSDIWADANQFSNAYSPTPNGRSWGVYVDPTEVRTGWWILSKDQPVVYAAFWYEGPGTAHDVRVRFDGHSYPPAGNPPVGYSHAAGFTTAVELAQVPGRATITWRRAGHRYRETVSRRQMTMVGPTK